MKSEIFPTAGGGALSQLHLERLIALWLLKPRVAPFLRRTAGPTGGNRALRGHAVPRRAVVAVVRERVEVLVRTMPGDLG